MAAWTASPGASASVTDALPLAGAAYRVAQQAYDAYARRDYPRAQALAREAIRQRPDVAELRLLLANAIAAQKRYALASRTLSAAIRAFGPRHALVARRAQIDALLTATEKAAHAAHNSRAQAAAGGPLTGPAYAAASTAYQAYGQKRYADAVPAAKEAITLRPDVLRLRLLLIDAAHSAGDDALAWRADTEAVKRFGDNDDLRLRRLFIGATLGPKASIDADKARRHGELPQAIADARAAVAYAPDNTDYRVELFDALATVGDWPGLEAAATDAIAYDDSEIVPFLFRAYARAVQGRVADADTDLGHALAEREASRNTRNVARATAADIWLAQGRPQHALDVLGRLAPLGDDTDALVYDRLDKARRQLRHAAGAPQAADSAARVASAARPVVDCEVDPLFGASCDVYPADPGFAAQQASERAAGHGDKQAALRFAREAAAAAPDNALHQLDLLDALDDAGKRREALAQAQKMVREGQLDALTPLSAAYVALRAGDNRRALKDFRRADAHRRLPASALADAGYAGLDADRDADAAGYFKRAIDALSASGHLAPAARQELEDLRSAHAEATRKWGFTVSLDYQGAGFGRSYAAAPNPSAANNWQVGAEAYWRPLGNLGDRLFELYASAYDGFGVAHGGGASGVSTLDAAFGARVKPFAKLDAIFAFERIVPIGSQAQGDWLGRVGYSGGIGTERRLDVPSWWTVETYDEAGHYLSHSSTYATGTLEAGRTWRVDRASPRLTVFPHAVLSAGYDSSIDRSIPVGAGFGVSTRYAFRGGKYDAARSSVDLSLQYRFRVAGDDRARGVFFDAVFSY